MVSRHNEQTVLTPSSQAPPYRPVFRADAVLLPGTRAAGLAPRAPGGTRNVAAAGSIVVTNIEQRGSVRAGIPPAPKPARAEGGDRQAYRHPPPRCGVIRYQRHPPKPGDAGSARRRNNVIAAGSSTRHQAPAEAVMLEIATSVAGDALMKSQAPTPGVCRNFSVANAEPQQREAVLNRVSSASSLPQGRRPPVLFSRHASASPRDHSAPEDANIKNVPPAQGASARGSVARRQAHAFAGVTGARALLIAWQRQQRRPVAGWRVSAKA